jgi:hypothetical protein
MTAKQIDGSGREMLKNNYLYILHGKSIKTTIKSFFGLEYVM